MKIILLASTSSFYKNLVSYLSVRKECITIEDIKFNLYTRKISAQSI